MIIERSMDSRYLSNAFVVGDEPGGVAVFVDSGAPLEPLLETIERERLTPTPSSAPTATRITSSTRTSSRAGSGFPC